MIVIDRSVRSNSGIAQYIHHMHTPFPGFYQFHTNLASGSVGPTIHT